MSEILRRLSKNRFLKFGAPFLILLVGGSFGLEHFAKLRYDFRKSKKLKPEELETHGVKMRNKGQETSTLEAEYKRLQEMDLDTWSNVRGPRPWENSKIVQMEQRQEIANQSDKSPTS